ncbi:MAG: hypothetical protein ACK58L_13775 [Planctomycetota bacterium]
MTEVLEQQRDHSSELRSVSRGLFLKRIAMGCLLVGLPLCIIIPDPVAWATVAMITIVVDLAGRVLCTKAPITDRKAIRFSIAAQSTGLILLCVLSRFNRMGILSGLAAAMICQISAARWFVSFLTQIATEVSRPDLAASIELLRSRLSAFAISLYGAGLTALIVSMAAVIVILFSYGLLLPIASPMGLMVIIFVLLVSHGLYLRMAMVYRSVIQSIARAIEDSIADGKARSSD